MSIEKKIEEGLTASQIANSLTLGYSTNNVAGNNMSENNAGNKKLNIRTPFSQLPPEEQEKIKKRQAEIKKYLNNIELSKLLKELGASQSKEKPEYWKVPEYGVIKTEGQNWQKYNRTESGWELSSTEKGWGTVFLLRTIKDVKTEIEAIKWLKEKFGLPPKVENKKPIEQVEPQASEPAVQEKPTASIKDESQQKSQEKIEPQKVNNNKQTFTKSYSDKEKERAQREERKKKRKDLVDLMQSINIRSVFEQLGADGNQDGDPSKWKIPGVGNFINKGQRWKNVNHEKKGFGGIFLAMMALDIEFNEALNWMVEKFGTEISEEMRVDLNEIFVKKEFTPPENTAYNIHHVKRYLTEERGIPPYLIEKLINKGTIYAQVNKRCVFISDAAAELRSTCVEEDGTVFKGCCIGSQTDMSGFNVMPEMNANEKTFSMVEAAIDALSYNSLFPGRAVLSTNGSGRFLLQYRIMIEALEHGWKIKTAFDADWAGDLAAQKLFNALYVRSLLSHNLGVEPEIIDNWILETSITFNLYNSPHMNFFNEGWDNIKKAYDLERQVDSEGKVHMVAVDNGKTSVPIIEIEISKDLHPKLLKGKKTINVVKKGYEIIIMEKGLARERPINKKDWNEEMLMLGSKFVLDYERCAGHSFKEVPQLPKYLEQYRSGNPMDNPYITKSGEIQKKEAFTAVSSKPKI